MCYSFSEDAYEPRHEKTNILHIRMQSNREADHVKTLTQYTLIKSATT